MTCPDLGQNTVALSIDVYSRSWYVNFPLCKLLELLPGLRELSLSPPTMYAVPSELLQNLTSVQFDFRHPLYDDLGREDKSWMADGVLLHIVARYLWLPSLRRVQAKMVYLTPCLFYQRGLDEIKRQFGGSSVDELHFLDCKAYGSRRGSLVAGFISSVKRLKSFVLEMNGIGEAPLTEVVNPIGRALTAHHATLDEVVLAESNTLVFASWAMGNLRAWCSLKRLAISIHTTFGNLDIGTGFENYPSFHKYIPPQLEELQIQFTVGVTEPDEWAYFPGAIKDAALEAKVSYEKGLLRLWELTGKKDACVPGMKSVIWWFQHSSQDPLQDLEVPAYGSLSHLGELGHAFGRVGVEFVLVSTPFFKDTPFGRRVYE